RKISRSTSTSRRRPMRGPLAFMRTTVRYRASGMVSVLVEPGTSGPARADRSRRPARMRTLPGSTSGAITSTPVAVRAPGGSAVGVGQRPALAGVAHAVVVAVALLGVGDRRAVVGEVGDAVAVGVGEARGVDRVHAGDRVQVEAREAAEAHVDRAAVDAREAN